MTSTWSWLLKKSVRSEGGLSGNFAFVEGVQERLLLADGIEVKDGKVDLSKYGI